MGSRRRSAAYREIGCRSSSEWKFTSRKGPTARNSAFWQAFSIGIGNTGGHEAIPPLIYLQTIATGQKHRRHDSE
jgi:hypothetical protein